MEGKRGPDQPTEGDAWSRGAGERRRVVAANRGPVSFHDDPSGEPVVTRGPGGLVTVLTEVLRDHPARGWRRP